MKMIFSVSYYLQLFDVYLKYYHRILNCWFEIMEHWKLDLAKNYINRKNNSIV